jgi:acetyl-CoA acetyltransferase
MGSVVQREWAAKNPRAIPGRPALAGELGTPITVEDVLHSRMIAYPFRLLQCCLVTDGGDALILVSATRTRDFPKSLPLAPNRGRSTCSAPA